MEEERLSLLRASIEAQSKEIERIFAKVEERRHGKSAVELESLAYQLHSIRTGVIDGISVLHF